MLPKIIFCAAVSLATVSVILLALISPVGHKKPAKKSGRPLVAFSLYIQRPQVASSDGQLVVPPSDLGALIFHNTLTEGPENTSRVVGKAQGFIIPIEHFAHSAFNIIYLTLDTHEYSGSLSVQAKDLFHKDTDELTVVGGTGSFAFAQGLAVFARPDQRGADLQASYRIKLQLKFPNRTQTIP